MNDQPLDPRLQRLIALLYGELSAEEERTLRLEIEGDPSLREEWEALVATRGFLGQWEEEEPSPGFVFVKEEGATVAGRLRAGWKETLRRLALGSSWGIAAAAVLVAALALGHFRVERVAGGLAFRFGEAGRSVPSPAPGPSASDGLAMRPGEDALFASGPGRNAPGGVPVVPATSEGTGPAQPAYLTREEFQAYTAGMTQTMLALLNEYGQRRDRETVAYLQAAWTEIQRRQGEDYQDLRQRIETVGLGLAREQYSTNAQLDLLMDQNRQGGIRPVRQQAPAAEEGDQR